MSGHYPAGRAVAPLVAYYFARSHRERGLVEKSRVAPLPEEQEVEALIGAAFWASLLRQEGYDPTISLAYVSPSAAANQLLLEKPLPLAAESLAKLAPAVERPGIHLGVWSENGQLAVWGATHALPAMCFVIEVAAPGLLVVKQSAGDDIGKFINVAVLQGDQVKELNTLSLDWPDAPRVIKALLHLHSSAPIDATTALIHLAESMRRHARGGSLLIVPPNTDWRESIVSPISYSVTPSYSELRDLLKYDRNKPQESSVQEINRVIDFVAGLTAVDGASVLAEDCSLLAFGVKIKRREGHPLVERVIESEPVGSGCLSVVHPVQLGGTRHLAAAQFAHDQRDAVALVASQDGKFTVFAWSPHQEMVQAYRVEALLL